jgi:trimethylamine:corrinoid methyltransferase-like protein
MRIKAMAGGDVAKIHQATLAVLEQTGVKFPSEKALHSCVDRDCSQFAVEMAGVIAGSKE